MTELEIKRAQEVGLQLAEAIHEFNKLNEKQIKYLDLLFKKMNIECDIDKIIEKGINSN